MDDTGTERGNDDMENVSLPDFLLFDVLLCSIGSTLCSPNGPNYFEEIPEAIVVSFSSSLSLLVHRNAIPTVIFTDMNQPSQTPFTPWKRWS